jgi:hypothetical protein
VCGVTRIEGGVVSPVCGVTRIEGGVVSPELRGVWWDLAFEVPISRKVSRDGWGEQSIKFLKCPLRGSQPL